jgi:glyoxylase-like metal-dependent hydrolase (beta-lactamase superfamily II)
MNGLAVTLTLALLATPVAAVKDPFDESITADRGRYRLDATGFVTDSRHPKHPGDFLREDVVVRVFVDPTLGAAAIEFESGQGDEKDVYRYFCRGGRVFQVGDDGHEIDAPDLSDLSPATVAAIHPALVAMAAHAHPEHVDPRVQCFAWNGELWEWNKGRESLTLWRRTSHHVHGDGRQNVVFGDHHPDGSVHTTITQDGRTIADLQFAAAVSVDSVSVPPGDHDRDLDHVVAYDELKLDEVAPHLFKIDIAPMNTRVSVAEFSDFVVVIEGAYTSQACDLIARRVRESLKKPVRYFAFSHLHGQYVGGTRSWIHEGATILVPPTTKPLIERIAQEPREYSPDALARDPKPLRVETIADRRTIEDDTNSLTIFNVESGHTDEYFITYFSRPKVLLTGDLLFYRPGQPLKGRSKQLCDTIAKLGLDVDRFLCTWPLAGYDTKNIVTREEMRAACAP